MEDGAESGKFTPPWTTSCGRPSTTSWRASTRRPASTEDRPQLSEPYVRHQPDVHAFGPALLRADRPGQGSDLSAQGAGQDPDGRPAMIADLLRRFYPEVVELGQNNGTVAQLDEVFRTKYGLSGNTIQATAFTMPCSTVGARSVDDGFARPLRTPGETSKRSRKPQPKPAAAVRQDTGLQRVTAAASSSGPEAPSRWPCQRRCSDLL